MELKDRIGFDAGTNELESMIDYAVSNNFYFIDFNADKGLNHLDRGYENFDCKLKSIGAKVSRKHLDARVITG